MYWCSTTGVWPPLMPGCAAYILEIIDDRAASKGTIITTQLPTDHWHAWLGDDTIADAILDRVMQRIHNINLTGESMRRDQGKRTGADPAE